MCDEDYKFESCPYCLGTGDTPGDGDCPYCNGTGNGLEVELDGGDD